MALKIDKLQLQIEIQHDQAMSNLKGLEKEISNANRELRKLPQDSAEYQAQSNKVKQLSNRYEELASEIKLTDMPLNLLIKRQRELTGLLNQMRPSSENYGKYREEIEATKNRIKELRGNAQDTGLSLGKFADGFNKYAALGASAVASLTGIAMTARKSVEDFAKMKEAEAQVSKYTDLTAEEISQLNEKFKQMDTRTPREQLNALAGQAGQLGIKGSDNIMSFVSAADKINVALGEDIGADAVKTIGRLTQMFGEDKKLGLSKAMLSTGSAINQLAQSVGADATYLVDFENRVGGVAKQAKISQAQILGYAGVLNKNGQQVEMAGTAVQSVLMKMYQAPAKFAKLAGQDVTKFTTLLKKDANEAFLQLLTTLQKQGGLDKLAPIFKDMGLDGARASSVLTTLADKISDVRAQQKIATDAYREAKSVDNEFNVQNNTVQAGLDKAKKNFHDISVELGERLEPIMKHMISGTSELVRAMLSIINFTSRWSGTIISVTSSIALYVIAINIATIATKVHTFWTDVCIVSLKKLRAAIMANPWGALAVGIGLVVGLIIDVVRHTNEESESLKSLHKINDRVNKDYVDQSSKIQTLSTIVHNNNVKLSERQTALNELKKIVPEYNALLSREGKLTNDNTQALREYLTQLNKKLALQASKDELQELYKNRLANLKKYNEALITYNASKDRLERLSNRTYYSSGDGGDNPIVKMDVQLNTAASRLVSAHRQLKETDAAIKDINKSIGKMDISVDSPHKGNQDKPTNTETVTPTGTTTSGNGSNTDKNKSAFQTAMNNNEALYQQELNKIKQIAIDKNHTEAEFDLEAIKAKEKYLNDRKALQLKFAASEKVANTKADIIKDEKQTESQLIDLQKEKVNTTIKLYQDERDRAIKVIEDRDNIEKKKLADSYAAGEISKELYEMSINGIDRNSKDAKLAVLEKYNKDVSSIETKGGQAQVRAVEDSKDALLKAEIESATARAAVRESIESAVKNFSKSYGQKTPFFDKQESLNELEKTYQAARALLIKNGKDTTALDRVYAQAKLDIENDYQNKLLDIREKNGVDVTAERYKLELAQLEQQHQAGLISEQEYNDSKKKLDDDYLNYRLSKYQSNIEKIGSFANNISNVMSQLAEAETVASDAKYDKQIKAAKKAGKDITKLEEQKEEAQNKIKKKYADMQFASSVLQIGSSTAVAAMEAYKAMAGIPYVGPALGALAAAAAVAAGAVQIKVAKANRDAAKGLYGGGYASDYVEGYTSTGNPSEVAGAIPVHKNEFVANHEAVANPAVRQFLDVFNIAQRDGSIRLLDTTAILSRLQLTGKYSGGYSTGSGPSAASTPPINVTASSDVGAKLDRAIELLTALNNKRLTIAMTDVRDGLNDLKVLESNASR